MKKTSKLTKVIKWARDNGYQCLDSAYGEMPGVTILTTENIRFHVEEKRSSLYKSRGRWKGYYAGLHMQITDENPGIRNHGYTFHYANQREIVREMEKVMERHEERKTSKTSN